MKRVLLPTDFSENSWNAIAYALQLLKDVECTFFLLNTYTPVIYHVEYVLVNPAQFGMNDPIRENSERCLENLRERINMNFKNDRHKFESISAFSTLIPEIKDLVDQQNIDLIVMGTKGATGAKEVLFGSNTVHVIKAAQCPVLAIPEDSKFTGLHEILFATDYEYDFSESMLQPMLYFASHYNSRINVLHLCDDGQISESQLKNKDKLNHLLKEMRKLFFDLDGNSVQEAISEFRSGHPTDMLVMINHEHNFFEKLFFRPTVEQLGSHTNLPFLVLTS